MLQQIFVTGTTFLCLQVGLAQQTATSVATDTSSNKVLEPRAATVVSGAADSYYRFDPAKTAGNNRTSFTNSDQSFELGMISAKVDQTFGNAAMTADLGFGRRAEEFSYTDGNTRFIIKQLNLSYTFKPGIKVTAGSWATHVGYEVVDAYANKNFSMSYMFSYGPFFHTGLKAEKSFGNISAMLGVSNPTDLKSATLSNKFLIGQLSAGSSDGKFKTYLNFQGGKPIDSVRTAQIDLVTTYTLNDKLSLGYNGTLTNIQQKTAESDGFGDGNQWWGSAGYLTYAATDWLALSLRSEYFSDQKQLNVFSFMPTGGSVWANTFSLNLSRDHITFIPEVRFERASEAAFFVDKDGNSTRNALSFLCAAVYRF